MLHEFLDGGGFKGFTVRANPDAPAFKKIVEQLPDIKDYPDSSNTDHWETLEARDGYRIQVNNGRRHNLFRIINRKNEPIAWGKRDYEQLGIMAFLSLFEERVIEIVDVADEKRKSGPLYQTIDSLKPIEELLEDASKALGDKSRTIKDSPLAAVLMSTWSEVAASFIGGSAGAALSFAVLYIGGKILGLKDAAAITAMLAKAGMLVGGGMFAGIFVFAMPVAILAAGGAIIVAKVKAEELLQEKERLLQKAIETQQAILAAMKIEIDAAKQRADYLNSLNELLRRAINDLRGDLRYAG